MRFIHAMQSLSCSLTLWFGLPITSRNVTQTQDADFVEWFAHIWVEYMSLSTATIRNWWSQWMVITDPDYLWIYIGTHGNESIKETGIVTVCMLLFCSSSSRSNNKLGFGLFNIMKVGQCSLNQLTSNLATHDLQVWESIFVWFLISQTISA
jgi:hypothetical protein